LYRDFKCAKLFYSHFSSGQSFEIFSVFFSQNVGIKHLALLYNHDYVKHVT